MRRPRQALALVTVLLPAVFTLWVSIQANISSTTTCVNGTCTTRQISTSDWSRNPLEVVAIVAVILLVGLGPAALILSQSEQSGGRILALWIAVPVLALATVGFAFTWMGSAAFFWGVTVLIAAIVATAHWIWMRLSLRRLTAQP